MKPTVCAILMAVIRSIIVVSKSCIRLHAVIELAIDNTIVFIGGLLIQIQVDGFM